MFFLTENHHVLDTLYTQADRVLPLPLSGLIRVTNFPIIFPASLPASVLAVDSLHTETFKGTLRSYGAALLRVGPYFVCVLYEHAGDVILPLVSLTDSWWK